MLYRPRPYRPRHANSRLGSQTVPRQLALSLVGQTVSLRGRANRVFHGVVAGILNETGRPKLVVDRVEYDLNQVLSVTPPSFN
jgi:hypothetical protein